MLETQSNLEQYVSRQMSILDSSRQELDAAVTKANDANAKAAKMLASRQLVYNKDSHHFTANYSGRIGDKYYSFKLADNVTLIMLHIDASGFTYNSSNGWHVNVGTLVDYLRPTFDNVTDTYFPYHNSGFRCSLGMNGTLTIDATNDFGTDAGCHANFMYVRKEE